MPRRRKYGFSFSWKRAVGISAFKGRLSRKIGIPLTRSGRQRKVGRMMGCCIPLALLVGSLAGLIAWGSVSLPLPRVPSRAEAQLQKDELQQPPDKPHFFQLQSDFVLPRCVSFLMAGPLLQDACWRGELHPNSRADSGMITPRGGR